MVFNAFIVDWTMDDYPGLKQKLAGSGFEFASRGDSEHIDVSVPFDQLEAFTALCQTHLNAPVNYIDIQYADRKTTVVIFPQEVFIIVDKVENERVKTWAIGLGLPPEQAEWATSF
jgi:hypothetical protein